MFDCRSSTMDFLLGRPTWCSQSEATRLDWRPGMQRMKAT